MDIGTYDRFFESQKGPAALINACYVLLEEYHSILCEVGSTNQLTEQEMIILVHLVLYPHARTQKKLYATDPHMSMSSICRIVESLRKKGYLWMVQDPSDRRSWIIHLHERGEKLGDAFCESLGQRLEHILRDVPVSAVQGFVTAVTGAVE